MYIISFNTYNITIFERVSDFNKIKNQILQNRLEPLYILHGEEPYFIDKLSQLIEEHALTEEEKAFNAYILYGKDSDVSQVLTYAKQFPMSGNRVLVIVREAQHLKGLVKSNSENESESDTSANPFIEYVKKPSPHTVLVICYKYKSLDKRTALYKQAQKQGTLFESKRLYENQIPDWITEHVRGLQMGIHPRAAFLLAETCGNDLSRIVLELEKIKSIAHKMKSSLGMLGMAEAWQLAGDMERTADEKELKQKLEKLCSNDLLAFPSRYQPESKTSAILRSISSR